MQSPPTEIQQFNKQKLALLPYQEYLPHAQAFLCFINYVVIIYSGAYGGRIPVRAVPVGFASVFIAFLYKLA
jgi:hypothetical protein